MGRGAEPERDRQAVQNGPHRPSAITPRAQQLTSDVCGKNAYLAPALSLAALRHKRAWVGLLTSEPHVAGLLAASLDRLSGRGNGIEMATWFSARLQRRGRPGFAPEFPVRRLKQAAPSRPPKHAREKLSAGGRDVNRPDARSGGPIGSGRDREIAVCCPVRPSKFREPAHGH
jgi:hypothetical protein